MGTGMRKGGRDFLELGTFNVMCAYCGRKRKANELVRDNEYARNLWCCPEHADQRHPQDYARGVPENMAAPFVQPPIVAFVSLPAAFPLSILPNPAVLTSAGQNDLVTEGAPPSIITTEGGSPLTLETATLGLYVRAVLPGWIAYGPQGDPSIVYVAGIAWSWAAGGVGIDIATPAQAGTQLFTASAGNSGILQVAITDSLDQVSIATVQVNS